MQGCNEAVQLRFGMRARVKLRGFSATDYLGKVSGSGQIEARWQLSERWGIVGFAGAGYVGSSFNDIREREAIPSYGAGLRFTVLKAKKINYDSTMPARRIVTLYISLSGRRSRRIFSAQTDLKKTTPTLPSEFAIEAVSN